MQREVRWLLQEKYNGKKTPEAQKDIARLEQGDHVDYVIGWVQFLGCKIDLQHGPLIPRSETEFWVSRAIEEIEDGRVLDMFAGSGCIGVAVLKNKPNVYVDFVEKDKKLLEQIEVNTDINEISKSNYSVLISDIFSGIRVQYNYILANPPYVPENNKEQVQQSVLEQEPHEAVFGGEDGLLYVRLFLEQVKNYVLPNGIVYMEFDSSQKNEIKKLAKAAGAKEISMHKDQYGKWRYVRLVF